MSETHLSRETYERLSQELEQLTTVGRTRIASQIEAARSLGDLSENGDYQAAKDEQARMEARIRQLHSTLEGAVIVENGDATAGSGEIRPGSIVTVRFSDGYEDTFLLGSIEERRDDVAIMSPRSPLGQALVGRGAGDSITYTQPTGAEETVEVVDVRR